MRYIRKTVDISSEEEWMELVKLNPSVERLSFSYDTPDYPYRTFLPELTRRKILKMKGLCQLGLTQWRQHTKASYNAATILRNHSSHQFIKSLKLDEDDLDGEAIKLILPP